MKFHRAGTRHLVPLLIADAQLRAVALSVQQVLHCWGTGGKGLPLPISPYAYEPIDLGPISFKIGTSMQLQTAAQVRSAAI